MFGFRKKTTTDAWLLAGLGNPGGKYAHNRHNIGFMVVDEIASSHGFPPFRSKFQSQMAEGSIAGQKAVLLKPQTYMNNSGQAVQAAAKFFKIPPERIIVFHDEIDLAPAKLRVKRGGGNAGHNGLRSIDDHLGTPDYWRVRLGVGRPQGQGEVHNYVLNDFAKAEQEWVEALVKGVSGHAALLLGGDEAAFMSKVAVATGAKA